MKNIPIYLFGLGNVGSVFIQQVLESQAFFKEELGINFKIVGLANSSKVYTTTQGIDKNWREDFEKHSIHREPDAFYTFSRDLYETRIAVDASASHELSLFYPELLKHNFHIVTANKIANTLSQSFYQHVRDLASKRQLQIQYETNVGAGLPIVETIRNFYESGEKITQINGVFSGSLGYIFNRFSKEDIAISQIIKDALALGFTEPDPREDLSGNDVARKLLILARESGISLELEDIEIENLVPEQLQRIHKTDFLEQIVSLDENFNARKSELPKGFVLRHLGQLDIPNKIVKVSLEIVPENSPLGQLSGSDGFFEIYSSSYKTDPLIIQGAGAGAAVTARGLVTDVIKVGKTINLPAYAY